jgi:hypothetical protein
MSQEVLDANVTERVFTVEVPGESGKRRGCKLKSGDRAALRKRGTSTLRRTYPKIFILLSGAVSSGVEPFV